MTKINYDFTYCTVFILKFHVGVLQRQIWVINSISITLYVSSSKLLSIYNIGDKYIIL